MIIFDSKKKNSDVDIFQKMDFVIIMTNSILNIKIYY